MIRTHLAPAIGLASALLTAQTTPTIPVPQGIVWYGSLDQGLAEAKRTQRPILVISGAPHCGGVSGLW